MCLLKKKEKKRCHRLLKTREPINNRLLKTREPISSRLLKTREPIKTNKNHWPYSIVKFEVSEN